MSFNPNISDANRNALFQRLGWVVALWWGMELLRLWLHPRNTTTYLVWIVNGDEARTAIGDIRLATFDPSVDCDSDYLIYATITDGGSGTGHTGAFYSDSSRSTQIGAFASTDDNNTATITASGSGTLTGAMDLLAISGNVNFAIHVVPPWHALAGVIFDGTFEEDQTLESQAKVTAQRVRAALQQGQGAAASLILAIMNGPASRLLTAQSDTQLLDDGIEVQTDGEVRTLPRGLLEDLRAGMEGNTAGSGAIKVSPQTASAAVSYPLSWSGGASPTVTLTDRALDGVIRLTQETELDANGPPTFSALFTPTDTRQKVGSEGQDPIAGEEYLTLGKIWRSPLLGIASVTVDYLASAANSTNTPFSTTATDWSVVGMTSGNSDGGKFWGVYVSADSTIRFYKSEDGRDNLTDADLVASCADPGTSTAFTATGSAGVTITGKRSGSSVANGDAGSVDFQPPVMSTTRQAINITITVTAEPALWQQLARMGAFGAKHRLHSASSPNILDRLIKRSGFPGGRYTGEQPR